MRMRTPRSVGSVLLSFALVLAGFLPFARDVRAATPRESDIPGITLPGTVATGLLGGSIYDVVYRLDVPAGRVIVIGLGGTAGTDFDLYLFDSTATTVLSSNGLLVKATGPDSSESLSFPSPDGGTFYLDLNGASETQGTFVLTVQLVADTTAPAVALQIAGGRTRTNSTTVDVKLLAFDDLSGVIDMAFSPDGVAWAEWQPFQASSTWTFPPFDGLKRLWVRVRNGVGQVSPSVSSSVTLDTVRPTVVSVDPAANTVHQGLRPTFRVQFSEPMDPISWTALGLVLQAASGARVSGSSVYDAATSIGSFVPLVDLAPGTAYVVTVGKVRDVAGNEVQPTGSWTLTVVIPNAVTLLATPLVTTIGGRVTLSGGVSVATGGQVSILERAAPADEPIAMPPLDLSGRTYSIVVVPAANTWYQASYPGSIVTPDVSSPLVRVIVRRGITLLGHSTTTTATTRAGQRLTLEAQVTPATAGAPVSFRLYRYDTIRRAYRYAGSWGRSTATGGIATFVWTPSVGRYYWKVAVLSTPDYGNNSTPAYRWTVTR